MGSELGVVGAAASVALVGGVLDHYRGATRGAVGGDDDVGRALEEEIGIAELAVVARVDLVEGQAVRVVVIPHDGGAVTGADAVLVASISEEPGH